MQSKKNSPTIKQKSTKLKPKQNNHAKHSTPTLKLDIVPNV